MATLTVVVGEAGSGKSTWAKKHVRLVLANGRKIVRLNRDELRKMLGETDSWEFKPWREGLVKEIEHHAASSALAKGYDVVIDDTNLTDSRQLKWFDLALESEANHFTHRMTTPFQECVARDMLRDGKEHVGRAVIERHFLTSGRADFEAKQVVLVDMDGTLADCTGIRDPYDESLVHLDKPSIGVAQWVRNLAPEYNVVIVSGRHTSCGDATIKWLAENEIPFDHIFMRNSGDNRPDEIIKQEILNAMLRIISKTQIAFVIDDRPKVIEMWRRNGLRVFPARGAVEPF